MHRESSAHDRVPEAYAGHPIAMRRRRWECSTGCWVRCCKSVSQQGGQAGWPDASRGMPGMGASGGLESMLGGGSAGRGSSGSMLAMLLPVALQLVQQNGGIEGLLGKMRSAGHGAEADSWVSTGRNMPIDAGALSKVFGDGTLDQMAQQTSMPQQQVAGGLAALLPQIVDQLSPTGRVETGADDELAQVLAAIQGRRSNG